MNQTSSNLPLNTRTPTGVPRLDTLIDGGWFKGGMYVIQGPPGLGKTILASQACFEHARLGMKTAFFSLLAEPSGRAISYLKQFDFFDPDAVGDAIEYLNGYQTLKEDGPDGLLSLLKESIQTRKLNLLVLDGLDSVPIISASQAKYREFVYSLQVFASVSNCTVVMITPVKASTSSPQPEHAISDGVIELSETQVGARAIREIKILKFRGSNFLKGRHEFEITKDGIVIHPRTESRFGKTPAPDVSEKRIRMGFGIQGFDDMLKEGLLSGSMTALIGAPGVGKTTLGLSFLSEGARLGQAGVYFGFYETPERVLDKAESLNISIRNYVDSGLIELQWQQAVENSVDALAERLLERIRNRNSGHFRVFIDGMSGFRRAMTYPERFAPFFSSLTNELRNIGATTIFSEETEIFSSEVVLRNPELASICDNVLFMRYVELKSQLYRLISIMKIRDSDYDSAIREFSISGDGISVCDSFVSAESILTGHAKIMPQSSLTESKVRRRQ